MPRKRPKLREDMAETARRVFLESIGEKPKTPPPDERTEKNPEAVRRGKRGGTRGGTARMASLSDAERSKLGRRAAARRWRKPDGQ